MATLTGSDILAKSLVSQGMDTLFYIMGGPMIETEAAIIKLGARAIDTRHEQAASLMAHAYSRITRKPGVCMGASGPGATNLVTGVANAFVDAAPMPRTLGDPGAVSEAIALLAKAERPLILGGSGVWWSDAAAAFQAFVEATGIPFYTTPISRGTVPEDHELAFLNARAKAFSEVDVLLAVGTRFNFVIQFGRPPRFAADAKFIHVDVNPTELNHNRQSVVPNDVVPRAVHYQ